MLTTPVPVQLTLLLYSTQNMSQTIFLLWGRDCQFVETRGCLFINPEHRLPAVPHSTCGFSLGFSHAVDLFAIANLIAGRQAGAMSDNGPGAAAFRVQNQIRRNAQDMQEYLADLGSWEKSIKKKDK